MDTKPPLSEDVVGKLDDLRRQIECQAILDLMGKEPYLAKGHVENGEYRWTVVADKISVTELRGLCEDSLERLDEQWKARCRVLMGDVDKWRKRAEEAEAALSALRETSR